MRKTNVTWVLIAISFLICSKNAFCLPIFIDSGMTQFYNFELSINSSINVVPGQVGYINAELTNTGNFAASFKDYISSNPIGGFGYDFNLPGMAINGAGGGLFSGNSGEILLWESGLTNVGEPNYSHLNGVTINPGSTLNFVIGSFALNPSVSLGSSFFIQSNASVVFGEPIYEGLTTGPVAYTVDIIADSSYSAGPFQKVELKNFTFQPANNPSNPNVIPEPTSMLLFGSGLLGALIRKKILR